MHPFHRADRFQFTLSLLIGAMLLALGVVGAPPSHAAAATEAAAPSHPSTPSKAAAPSKKPVPSPSSSPGPLLWTAPDGVDTQPIDSMACPATTLCVAVGRAGHVLWSADPAGGRHKWFSADVDGANELTGISCPTTTLCVAVDGRGNVITSADPTGGAAAWTVAPFDPSTTQNNTDNAGSVLVRGVSCPSIALCVAVDAAGNVLSSSDPTGGAVAWTINHADTNTSYSCIGTGLACQPPLVSISCPSTAQCAAVDFSGNLLTSGNPAAPLPWTSTPTNGGRLSSLFGISCPNRGFCATVDGDAARAITLNPLTPSRQHSHTLPDALYGIWCPSRSLCLASVQTRAGISGLLGSFDPAAANPTWSLSSLGGVNAVSCPSAKLCLAADDEGNIAAGETTTAIKQALLAQLLSGRHLLTIAALAKTGAEKLKFTSLIAAQVNLTWTVAGTGARPLTVASTSHRFKTPGTAILRLRLTQAGRRLFRAATARLTLAATVTFAASTGSVISSKKLTFTHP